MIIWLITNPTEHTENSLRAEVMWNFIHHRITSVWLSGCHMQALNYLSNERLYEQGNTVDSDLPFWPSPKPFWRERRIEEDTNMTQDSIPSKQWLCQVWKALPKIQGKAGYPVKESSVRRKMLAWWKQCHAVKIYINIPWRHSEVLCILVRQRLILNGGTSSFRLPTQVSIWFCIMVTQSGCSKCKPNEQLLASKIEKGEQRNSNRAKNPYQRWQHLRREQLR
jgi:hypothetical protein